ncbi:MAG: sensor histidine kinase, partial [Allomuricauda sp.]
IKYTVDYVLELNKNNKLLALQTETEMKFLKAQIQPHFFFNVLNSLYSLTLNNSKKAPEVVLKLSEIMEYVIYDTKKKRVPLPKEINYVRNYIELEKMRRGDLVEYKIETIGSLENVALPPFLFLPFVENCFKHGQTHNGKIDIAITFRKNENELWFLVKNSYEKEHVFPKKSGIGLKNIRRRLELLYGNDFNLEASPQENHFLVNLKIPLP